MAETKAAPNPPEVLYCTVHPTVETSLRCNKCGRPMCIKCARRTPVGYRCKECVSNQQAIFFNAQPLDPLIQLVVSTLLSVVGAFLVGVLLSRLSFFFLTLILGIPASAFIGGLIADIAHRAAGRRHGRYAWIAVGAGIIIGALIVGAVPFVINLIVALTAATNPEATGSFGAGGFLLGALFQSLGWWIYVVVATGAGIGRLRMGK